MTDAKEAMDEEIRRCRACDGSTEILVRRLIRVLDNAGFAIVPKVATGKMIERSVIKIHRENKGIEYAPSQVWEAMVEIGAVTA